MIQHDQIVAAPEENSRNYRAENGTKIGHERDKDRFNVIAGPSTMQTQLA